MGSVFKRPLSILSSRPKHCFQQGNSQYLFRRFMAPGRHPGGWSLSLPGQFVNFHSAPAFRCAVPDVRGRAQSGQKG